MLSIYRENSEMFNVKGSSLKDYQPPLVLIKQGSERPVGRNFPVLEEKMVFIRKLAYRRPFRLP
jgi:hypothetical protein